MESIRSSLRGLGLGVCAVICLSLTAGEVLASSFGSKNASCESLLTSLNLNSSLQRSKPSDDEMSMTQVQRLKVTLEKMPSDEREALIAKLGQTDFEALRSELEKPVNSGSLIDNAVLNDLSMLFLTDLVSLNDAFPGVFSLPNASTAVFKVLEVSRKVEIDEKLNHPDLLSSIGLTSRFYGTLNTSLANLIQQAEVDYLGMRFPEQPSGFGRLWYRIKRFVFPLYKPVNETIDFTQMIQRQLHRVRMVDKLIVQLALSEAKSLNLTDSEVERLLKYVINSPEEIQDIEKMVEKIYGYDIQVGKSIPIGSFDIYGIAKRIRDTSVTVLLSRFDKINMDSLNEMDSVLSGARIRQGGPKRTEKDFPDEELQLRTEAANRAVYRQGLMYSGATGVKSKETYQVEEKYTVTRQEPDGEDEKGNTKYKTVVETHYRWIDVTPTYENILSGRFETGDRNVSGLDSIKSRTSRVREQESAARHLVSSSESLISDIFNHWEERRLKGKNRDLTASIHEHRKAILAALPELKKYADWNDNQILAQYSNDSTGNFRDRNTRLVNRLEASMELLKYLEEAVRRDIPRLTPVYELFGFDLWMEKLKSHRNKNYWIKSGMGVTGAGGATLLHPDVFREVMRVVESFPSPF